jgi:hypothetical protein
VVSRLDKLTRLARGQPELVHFLRQRLISVVTKFPPTAHAMCELLTGLGQSSLKNRTGRAISGHYRVRHLILRGLLCDGYSRFGD